MFKVIVAVFAFACVALVAAQAPPTCTQYTAYSYGYSTVGFNFVRRDHLLSFAESGGVVADVANQRYATFFRVAFNDTQGIPIFETGMSVHYVANNTNYFLSNGVCFEEYNNEAIPATLVPSNVKLANQVTIGSGKYNSYTSPFFDGQHAFFGVYEPTTCIPIHMLLSNVDETLGQAETNVFDFSNTADSNVFNLPEPCWNPIKPHRYEGHRPVVTAFLTKQ
eukprot:gene5762-6670_t